MRVPAWGLLFIFLLGFCLGWKINGWRLESQINASKTTQLTATLNTERGTAKKASAADALPAAAQQAQAQTARVITKELIRYVQSPAANHCTLNPEWVRIHNLAAHDTAIMPADSAGTSVAVTANAEAGGTVSDSEALGTITRNYDICRQEINRVDGWQAYYQSIKP